MSIESSDKLYYLVGNQGFSEKKPKFHRRILTYFSRHHYSI